MNKHTKHEHTPKNLAIWEKILLIIIYCLFIIGAGYLQPHLMKSLSFLGQFGGKMAFAVMLLFILIFLIVKICERKPFSHYGFKRFSKNQFTLMLLFILLLMPLAFLGRIIDPGYDTWYANRTGLATFAGVLFFAITMPFYVIKEEIIVRAFFQNRLGTYGFWWMALAVSLNFAFAHFFIPGEGIKHVIVWAISVFIGSFFLIVFFELTRNLWLSMLLHLLFNCIIGLQIYLHVAKPAYETMFWILMLAGALIAIKFAWKDFIHPFKEKIHSIRLSETIFILYFSIVVPLLLIFQYAISLFWIILILVLPALIIFNIYMLVDIIMRKHVEKHHHRALWIFLLIFFGIITAAIYYLTIKRQHNSHLNQHTH